MTRKKRFSISSDITQGISDVMNAVDHNVGKFRYEVVALSRIEIDPNNPRELMVTPIDILQGLQQEDPNYALKQKECDQLATLSHTIKEKGVINPIVLYRHADKYRIIAGERRYLASLIAKNTDIHARIINGTPGELDIKILQWIENNERQDLSLHERLINIASILQAYKTAHAVDKITIHLLQDITGLSKSQASNYLILVNGPSDLLEAIKKNQVTGFKKALLIAGVKDLRMRTRLIAASGQGDDLAGLKLILEQETIQKKIAKQSNQQERRGRPLNYINLGKVKNTQVIKKMVDIILEHASYKQYAQDFSAVRWDNYEEVTKVFTKLLQILHEV